MRTFQLSDAKSHKFWNIDVTGTSFTVTYGKVGTAGQASTKTFATPEKAQAEADKLIREKTGKGYRETTPSAPKSAEDGFVLGLIDHPDEPARWSAYADYLSEQGDPRGEFMRVQLALEDESLSADERKKLTAEEEKLLAAHEAEWLGPLAAHTVGAGRREFYISNQRVNRPTVAHRFERGRVVELNFAELSVAEARAYANAPMARLVAEVSIEEVVAEAPAGSTARYVNSYYTPGPDVPADIDPYDKPGLHALCRCPHLTAVRAFRLGERVSDDDEYFNSRMTGELAHHLVKQMPNLEHLELYAQSVDTGKLFALPLPRLRTLVYFHGHRYPLDRLADNPSLARLETLRCHPHCLDDNHEEDDEERTGAYIRLSHLRAICRSSHLRGLTHLSLRLTDFGDDGAEEIVASGLLGRLRVLDLRNGCMSDEGAKVLIGSPDFKKLEFVNLRANGLTSDGVRAVEATGVKADLTRQHDTTNWAGGDDIPEYLYEGDGE